MSEVERYWIDPSRLVQEGWHQDDTCVVKDWAYDRAVAERDALQALLTAADERADVLERVEARYRWLQKATPYRFKKIQDASVTDGGDVLYFHADRFDAAVDAELKPGEVKPDEHACTGCGAKGWTANCKECVPY